MSKMASEEQKVYNVLLVGETGVGKSTFLNTILNYLTYDNFADITDLKYNVGTKFTMMKEDFKEVTVTLGNDDNERQESGKSATKYPKSHQVNLPDGSILNLIDTPGLGDTRGIEEDYKTVTKMLEVIFKLEYLNAICILLKPNNSRLGVVFEYCIKSILGKLDRDMRKNVVFLFTNGRSSFYTPGDTHAPLKKILDNMDPYRLYTVPFDKDNTFCVENDWFRYLAAKRQGVKFEANQVTNFEDSWNKSSATAKRMINYIKSLPPCRVREMIIINDAKRMIRKLMKPIPDLLTLQRKNRRQLKLKKENLKDLLSNKKLFEEALVTDVKVPVQQTSYVHTQKTVSKSHIGHNISVIPPLYEVEIGTNKHTDIHERQQEKTVIVEQKVEDPTVKSKIVITEQKMKEIEDECSAIEDQLKEYGKEFRTLLDSVACFHVFLKENVPFYSMDETEAYFERMKKETEGIDEDDFKMYRRILNDYKAKKESTHSVTIEQVKKAVQNLIALKHSGAELKRQLETEDKVAMLE